MRLTSLHSDRKPRIRGEAESELIGQQLQERRIIDKHPGCLPARLQFCQLVVAQSQARVQTALLHDQVLHERRMRMS